jgi:predicted AAA+ superfamily ATPase
MEVKRMIILTRDEEDTIMEKESKIEVIPVWKWLLENKPEA